ncbi:MULTISPECIES: MFS transporter [Bacillaceae]|uniref:MFS transporter n=1 Tax=Evansella alkalicola TaxID=745819 RepID=A0ABS6JXB6_9BACI|nr:MULTISPECIES: MFS transporter [Bacillaceae]MBU9723234.1 MFS transporter [Bacillus alkalicola]
MHISEFFHLFKSIALRNIILCYSISRMAVTINIVVTYWFVWELTNSATVLGFLGSITVVATLTGLFSGIIVDRYNKFKLLIISDISRFLILLLVPIVYFNDLVSWGYFSIMLLLMNVVSQFYSPTIRSILLERANEKNLSSINSSLFIIEQVSLIMGASIAGILFIPLGITNAYLLTATLFIFSFLLILFTKKTMSDKSSINTTSTKENSRTILTDFKETYIFIFKTPVLAHSTPLILFLFFSFAPVFILLSVWSDEVLGKGAFGYSMMEIAYPIGMAIGGVCSNYFYKKFSTRTLITFCLIFAGISTLFFSFSRELVLSLFCLMVLGSCLAVANVSLVNIQTKVVPEYLRGRFFATTQTFISLVLPLGYSLSGYLTSFFGITSIFIFISVSFLLSSLIFFNLNSIKVYEKSLQLSN